MPIFGAHSRAELATVHPKLQELFEQIIRFYDCSILEGHREKAEQDRMRDTGRSQLSWPDSKHNSQPSHAVDVGPWVPGIGVPWAGTLFAERVVKTKKEAQLVAAAHFSQLSGIVLAQAWEMGIKIRWGGDWDGDALILADQRFDDLGHYELAGVDPIV